MSVIVYGITNIPTPIPEESIARWVEIGGLYVLLEDTALTRIRPARANLLAYQRLLESMIPFGCVLPIRFGTVMQDETAVAQRLVQPNVQYMRNLIERLQGCYEYSLRVIWQHDDLFAEARQRLNVSSKGVLGMDEVIAIGQQVAQMLERIHESVTDTVCTMLDPVIRDRLINPRPDDLTSLDAALLIDSADRQHLSDGVAAADQHYNGRLTFKLIGPLPLYSFVSLTMSDEVAGA